MSIAIQRRYTVRQVAIWALGAALLTAALLLSVLHGAPGFSDRFAAFLAADEIQAISFDNGAAPLFGMDTEPVIEGDVLEKWTRVKADVDRELEAVTQCRAGGACAKTPRAQRGRRRSKRPSQGGFDQQSRRSRHRT
jgi:hypothetical protein